MNIQFAGHLRYSPGYWSVVFGPYAGGFWPRLKFDHRTTGGYDQQLAILTPVVSPKNVRTNSGVPGFFSLALVKDMKPGVWTACGKGSCTCGSKPEIPLELEEDIHLSTGWWFGTFFIFPYIGNSHPNWLIFFQRGGPTTNQSTIGYWDLIRGHFYSLLLLDSSAVHLARTWNVGHQKSDEESLE